MKTPATKVFWSKKVEKVLKPLPSHIRRRFFAWVTAVELSGIREVRRSLALHDEPLKGSRTGQRSVRLNQAYRVIYIQHHEDMVEFLEVIEVHKHDY